MSFGEMILNFIWHGFHDQYGIPSIVLADGPGGIRVKQKYEAKNVETGETATYYQYCTAWPVDFVLAQSWDTDLLKRIGEAFGKELEEMDLDTIIRIHPEIVIVDELAHTNVEGSLNEKRWQDVMALLDEGINVISAINIQHIESVNEEVQEITGIEVKERVPDSVLQEADEVVNIDLTAEELIARLKAGKIYRPEKIQTALDNFFRTENILQLRELAVKEVALRVEK